MIKDDLIYLDHMLASFEKICQYTENVSYESFSKDEEKQEAIIRKIEVAGEATNKLSLACRKHYADIPWRAIAGMRDKLIHNYFDVDLDTVWDTATIDIPTLLPKIIVIREELGENKSDISG
jgi:uncharacterized protein with HEPN domain